MRLLALLLASACLSAAESQHVFLVAIDGLANFHLSNPDLVLPNLRALIGAGALARSSEAVFPTVTHPNHSMITGVTPRLHGVTGNDIPDHKSGLMIPGNSLPRTKIILAPTIFDAAKKKGLRTAAFDWPEVVDDAAIDYNLVMRVKPGERNQKLDRNAFFAELKADGVPVDWVEIYRTRGELAGVADAILVEAAAHTIRKHKPNLLAIHIDLPDHEQHAYGFTHPIALASLTKADAMLGQMVRAAREAGIAERTTFVVVSDHGFASVYDEINIRPFFEKAGIENKVRFFEGGWAPFLGLEPDFDRAKDGPKLEEAFAALRRLPNIVRIYSSEEFPSLGLAKFTPDGRTRGEYLIAADVATYLVWAADDSTERRKRQRPAHGHGYLATHPQMKAMLLLSGAGVKKDFRLGDVRQIDVAPTIAALLGLEFGSVEGRALTEALR